MFTRLKKAFFYVGQRFSEPSFNTVFFLINLVIILLVFIYYTIVFFIE